MTRDALITAYGPANPFSAILARNNDTPIITRDRLILAYASEGHARALAC